MSKIIRYTAFACALAVSASLGIAQESQPGGQAQGQSKAKGTGQSAAGSQQSGSQQSGSQRGGTSGESQRFSQDRGGAAAGQVQARGNDALLASMLVVDNMGEIQLSQLGKQRSQNQQVQQFADMMVKEHTQMIQKLQEHGAQVPAQGQGGESASGQRSAANGQAASGARSAAPGGAAGATAGSSASMGLDPLQLKKEIGQQMVQNSSRQLGEYEGEKFDKAFIGEQLVLHMHMLSTLQAMQRHASPEFRQVLDEGIQTTQEHAKHAGQLMASLDKGGSDRAQHGQSSSHSATSGASGNRPRSSATNSQSSGNQRTAGEAGANTRSGAAEGQSTPSTRGNN